MLIEIVAALLFVASGTLMFNDRFRENKALVGAAAIIALISTYYLTEQIVDRAVNDILNDRSEPQVSVVSEPQETKPAGPKVGSLFQDCSSCPRMVVLPKGTFVMGSPKSEKGRDTDEEPQHSVTLNYHLAVGKFEVTQEEWQLCVTEKGCKKHVSRPTPKKSELRKPRCCVHWTDTKDYIKWLSKKTGRSYRLLTESEWEFAARGATKTAYWWGNTGSKRYANYSSKDTVEVGKYPANPFGLNDMHGNAWEWVEDCYARDSYSKAPTNGLAWRTSSCTRRVSRSGAWNQNATFMRSASRIGNKTDAHYTTLGFRVAAELPEDGQPSRGAFADPPWIVMLQDRMVSLDAWFKANREMAFVIYDKGPWSLFETQPPMMENGLEQEICLPN